MSQLRSASFALAVGTATLTLSLSAAAQTPPAPPVAPAAPPAAAPAPPDAPPPPPGYGYAPPPPYGQPPPPGYPPPPPGYGPPPGAYYYPPPPRAYYGPPPYLPPPATERRSTGAMVTGIVLTSIGGVLLITAAIGLSTGIKCADADQAYCTNDFAPTALGLGVGALVSIAVGIPLLIYGARRVPIAPGSAPPPEAKAIPVWVGAPGGAGWVWRF